MEGRRALQGEGPSVQKSASVGVIRAGAAPPSPVTPDASPRLGPPRGILKSCSTGAIKPAPTARPTACVPAPASAASVSNGPTTPATPSTPTTPATPTSPTTPASLAASPDFYGVAARQTPVRAMAAVGAEPRACAPARAPSQESCAEVGGSPPGRLRALRLQRAKEEFLTRGPGARSWGPGDAADETASYSSSSALHDPFEEAATATRVANRLSQVSVGSESSVELSLEQQLVKSRSAGALEAGQGRRRERDAPAQGGSLPRAGIAPGPSASEQDNASLSKQSATGSSTSKFGISSITSRFRKVRMRRGKEKEPPRMSAVSQLCRQSLLVDLHISKGAHAAAAAAASGCSSTEPASPEADAVPAPSSKSCPSSPVLQRSAPTPPPSPSPPPPQPPLARPEDTAATASWIRNPARRMFWNK